VVIGRFERELDLDPRIRRDTSRNQVPAESRLTAKATEVMLRGSRVRERESG